MAKFVLTAQLQLQAPKNAPKVVGDIQRQIQGVTVPVEVKNAAAAAKQIDQVTNAAQRAGSAAEAMGRSFGLAVKRFAAFTVASRAVSLFTNSLANAVDEAIAFQREVVRVSQVTGKSVKDLRGLTDTISRLSTTLGTSSKDLLSTATVLAQAGVQAQDLNVALETLAKTTLAPNFDSITETAEGAVAILAQFGKGVGALEQQLSSVNAVAGAFAVESEDLIGAVRRFGGVFKASGGSLEELLAVFTAVRATTRESGESIATGLRTIFTRIQRPKTIEFLRQFGIELTTLDGKFVGPFEAAKRLSDVLGKLEQGDLTFIRVAEELGGFRQIGKVIPLLQQFAVAQEALNVAQQGSDSLAKDAATAQQALSVQITKVKEEFLALVRSIADSSSFQLFARTALEIASSLIKVADAIKPLIPLLGTLAAFKFAQGLAGFASSAGAAVRGLGTLAPQRKNKGGEILAFASGGVVPGTGNRDTVPAMLTPGEFVIRKSSVNKIGADTLAAMNENRYAGGGIIKVKNPEKYGAFVLDSKSGAPIAQNPVEMSSSANLKANELLTRANITEAGQARGKGNQEKYQIQGPFPVFGIGATQSIQNDFQAEFSKASESAIAAGADAILKSNVSKSLDIGPFKGSDNFEFNIQDVLKGAKSTIEGYLLEAVVGSVGGLKAGTDKPAGSSSYADFDFPNIGAEGAATRLQKLFDPNERISNLKKADAKRQRSTAADSDKGLQNKVLKDLDVGDFDFIPAASGVGDKALLDYAKGLTNKQRASFNFPTGSAANLKKLPKGIDRQALENAYNVNATQKALGGLIQRFSKGGEPVAQKTIVQADNKFQGSHIGGDVTLDNAQLGDILRTSSNVKLKRSILNRYKDIDTSDYTAAKIHEEFSKLNIDNSEIEDIKNKIGLQVKYPTKLNFPSLYNQALRETDPRLVAKDDLSNFMSGAKNLVSPISGSANKSDKVSKALNEPEILGDIKRSLLNQLQNIPTMPQNTVSGIKAYDTDNELNSLQSAFVDSVKNVKPELVDLLISKADFIFQGGKKRTSKGKLRSSQDRFQAVIPQAKMLGGVIQKFAKAGIVKKGEQASGVGIFDSDMIAGGTAIKKAILDKIKASGKQYEVITGPAGSGKTTMATARFGKNFILSDADVGNYDRFVVLSGAAKTKTGDFSDEVQSLLSGASKISVLAPDPERILQQRQGRIDAALAGNVPDQRSTGALQGTMKAPTEANEELFKKYKNVEILRKYASGGPAPSDTVPALLTPGEFVINKNAAQNIGYGNLNRMNKHGVTGFAKGGAVGVQKFGRGGGVLGGGASVDIFALVSILGLAQQAIANFGDKTAKASDEIAAWSIGLEKGLSSLISVAGIAIAVTQARKAISGWANATEKSDDKQADSADKLSEAVDSTVDKLQNIDLTTIQANKVIAESAGAGALATETDQLKAGGDPEVEKLMMGVLGLDTKVKKQEQVDAVDELIKGVKGAGEGDLIQRKTPTEKPIASAKDIAPTKAIILDAERQIRDETAKSKKASEEKESLLQVRSQIKDRASQINAQGEELKKQRVAAVQSGDTEAFKKATESLQKLRQEAVVVKQAWEQNTEALKDNKLASEQSKNTLDGLRTKVKTYNDSLEKSRGQLSNTARFVDKFSFSAQRAVISFKDTSAFKNTSNALKTVTGAFNTASNGVKKLTSDITRLATSAKSGISAGLAPGGGLRKGIGAAGSVGATALGAIAAPAAIASELSAGIGDYLDTRRERAMNEGDLRTGVQAAGNAEIARGFSSLFTLSGIIQASADKKGFIAGIKSRVQDAKIGAAQQFATSRAESSRTKIEEAMRSGAPVNVAALRYQTNEAFAATREEAKKAGGVKEEEVTNKLRVEARKEINSLADLGVSITDLKVQAEALAGTDEELRISLLKQVDTVKAAREAQEALNKANFDSLKLTSAFGAAAEASSRFVAGLESGVNSLAIYADELENASGKLGVDTSNAINQVEKQLLASAGGAGGGSVAASIQSQANVARSINAFSVSAGGALSDLKLGPDQEDARRKLQDAFADSIPKNADPATKAKLENIIRKNIDAIQGDPSQIDLSKIAQDIQKDASELSKGFNESAKLQAQHNATMNTLYQKREQLEQKAAEAANQAIETQLEAAKIFEEFGGAKLTGQQELGARVAQFNNIGALGGLGAQLTTGNASDIRNVASQIGETFAAQNERFMLRASMSASGITGPAGFSLAEDKRPEAEAANKALLQFTKQRIQLLKEELSIVQKKNAEEKSALESLLGGDIEGFLDKQAAAGAAAALTTGNAELTKLFSASALGAGFKSLEGQGLSDQQMRQAENLTLQRFGIQSTGVLSGTTTQQEALKAQGRELAGVLGELSQQEAAFAQAEFQVNNAVINAAQLSFDRKLSEVANLNAGAGAMAQGLARGGVVYANRGMFVPRGTDIVPAMLTPGEFVVNRSAVQRGNNLQILQAMNSGGGASAPGAMSGGGQVRYYNFGGIVESIGNMFGTALPQLTTVFSGFASTVEKLLGTKFQVALDPTNINVNFNGTSFLSTLKDELKTELFTELEKELGKYKFNNSGDFVRRRA